MIYKLPIHSIIDVITNSSTEIFITTNEKAAEFAKDLINSIFKLANIDGTFDDYFNIRYDNDIYDMEDVLSRSLQYGDDDLYELFNESDLAVAKNPEKEGDYWRIASALMEHWDSLIPENVTEYLLENNRGDKIRRNLIISSKDEKTSDIIHLNEEFNKIFEAYESYEG